MKKKSIKDKIVIGRREVCSLPQLELKDVHARIDSGAKTTALHAYNIEVFVDENEQEFVRFYTCSKNKRLKNGVNITLPLMDKRRVISSNGKSETRYLVELDIQIGTHVIKTEVTLTSRHKMTFPLLLGRNTISQGRFLIDVSKRFCLGKPIKI
jgi:ribosomal protein S6--L-glutamate ligase